MKKSSPINISVLKLIIPALSFFILLLATTNAESNLKPTELPPHPKSTLNPNSNSNSVANVTIPPHDKKPVPDLKPENPKPNLKPTTSPHDKKPVPNLKPTQPKSNSKPTLPKPNTKPAHPKSNSKPGHLKPKSNPKRPNATSPYRSVNHFCRSRRLDVKTTFCLQVLRSSPASTKAKDNQALLSIAADGAIQFGNKRIASMKKMITSKEAKKTKPELKAAVEECVLAYEGYLKQLKTLVEEAGVEAQLASYDSELAKLEINRCVQALSKIKNAEEIVAGNKVALDYARLSQNIADSI
ncbi:hypothetical protein OROGR_016584 [Orobanche gracilis]